MKALFAPRTDRNEDGSPVIPEFTSAQADRAVAFLAEVLLEGEISIDAVLGYGDSDWDALCVAHSREEWAGLITDAIASRIVCLMLKEQIARVTDEKMMAPLMPLQGYRRSAGAMTGETIACCPECLSVAISCVAFDGGVEADTGYHDAGEQFVCRDCGARGDSADVAWTVLEEAPLPKTITDTRLPLAARERVWDAAGLSFTEKLKRAQTRCPHLKTDPAGNCYECGKRCAADVGVSAGLIRKPPVVEIHLVTQAVA